MTGGGGDIAAVGTGVGDVDSLEVGGEGDAIGLEEGVFNEVCSAGGGAEAVDGGDELRRSVG